MSRANVARLADVRREDVRAFEELEIRGASTVGIVPARAEARLAAFYAIAASFWEQLATSSALGAGEGMTAALHELGELRDEAARAGDEAMQATATAAIRKGASSTEWAKCTAAIAGLKIGEPIARGGS